MYVIIYIVMMSVSAGGFDASEDITIPSPVRIFETEEQCHDRLRSLHKEFNGSSLRWDKNTTSTNDILYLLHKDKSSIWKCAETSTTRP
jgi:hypothetical protein